MPLCPSRGHVGKVTVPRGRGPRSLEINRPPLEDPNRSLGKVPKSTRSFRLSKTAPCPLRSDKREIFLQNFDKLTRSILTTSLSPVLTVSLFPAQSVVNANPLAPSTTRWKSSSRGLLRKVLAGGERERERETGCLTMQTRNGGGRIHTGRRGREMTQVIISRGLSPSPPLMKRTGPEDAIRGGRKER